MPKCRVPIYVHNIDNLNKVKIDLKFRPISWSTNHDCSKDWSCCVLLWNLNYKTCILDQTWSPMLQLCPTLIIMCIGTISKWRKISWKTDSRSKTILTLSNYFPLITWTLRLMDKDAVFGQRNFANHYFKLA